MAIKWVKSDPLVNERRALLLRQPDDRPPAPRGTAERYDLGRILTDHPELKALRVATAWAYAAEHRGRYAEFVGPDGSLVGPGFSPEEAAILPEHLRIPGVVVKGSPVSA